MDSFDSFGNTGKYFWIYCIYQGRPVIDGYWTTEQEAYQYGSKKMPVSFQLHCTNTINRARATQEIKHKIWDQTGNLDLGLSRAKHVK